MATIKQSHAFRIWFEQRYSQQSLFNAKLCQKFLLCIEFSAEENRNDIRVIRRRGICQIGGLFTDQVCTICSSIFRNEHDAEGYHDQETDRKCFDVVAGDRFVP
ncbi:MAG: hypothetical protein HY696_03180 [Deltaproteobacteria bacterium]|nr:hypothetical protein [Deltaproteobacteria bacterium]